VTLDLLELRALAEAATPAPWHSVHGIATCEVWSDHGGTPRVCVVNQGDDDATDMEHRDAAFIAAARSAVPALLDRVAELEAEIVALKARTKEFMFDALDHESDQVQMLKAGLREALDWWRVHLNGLVKRMGGPDGGVELERQKLAALAALLVTK